jgi:hypothetical protein
MLDFSHLPGQYGAATVEYFQPASIQFIAWNKPRGKSMCQIMLFGCGSNGGNGAVGANSTAAGGGGGSSGAQTFLTIPFWAIPDTLYLQLPQGGSGQASFISIRPDSVVNHLLAVANTAGAGGNAAGATPGAAGGASSVATAVQMPLGWQWVDTVLAGQPGIIGGVAVAGAALTLPVTGLLVTGGTGGGGLPAAAATATNGGSFTVPASPSPFPAHSGGIGSATATVPAQGGSTGYSPIAKLLYYYGGTGSSSTHGTATGAGLAQARGGDGAPGCGGGGSGGGLTGSTAATGGLGGPAFCIITCW